MYILFDYYVITVDSLTLPPLLDAVPEVDGFRPAPAAVIGSGFSSSGSSAPLPLVRFKIR